MKVMNIYQVLPMIVTNTINDNDIVPENIIVKLADSNL